MVETVLIFVLSAVAVVLAGVVLARSGDVIAARTGLGERWVGLVFMAVATSLPELTTDITAVRIGEIDLAAGDLFGSSMANMLVLAVVSLVPGSDLFSRAALDNALPAALAITLTCIAAITILMPAPATPLGVGAGTILIVLTYAAGTRAIFRDSVIARASGTMTEMTGTVEPAEVRRAESGRRSLRSAAIRMAGASIVVLVAAPIFATAARDLAEMTGLTSSFVGTWLVGISTSLPELVTSLAAVRIGAYNLAVANLFGSNAVNMVILLPLDLAFPAGPMLAAVHPVHTISALVAIVLMGIALAAIAYRAKGRAAMLEPGSVLLMVVYVLGLVLVFLGGRTV